MPNEGNHIMPPQNTNNPQGQSANDPNQSPPQNPDDPDAPRQNDQSPAVNEAGGPGSEGEEGAGSPRLYTVKVNGQERQVTEEELVKGFEKVSGADERFRQASELRQKAADGLRIQELMNGVRDPDLDNQARVQQIMELGSLLGASPEDLQGIMDTLNLPDNQSGNSGNSGSSGGSKGNQGNQGNQGGQAAPPALDDEQKRLIEWAKQKQHEERRQQIFGLVENGVDEDPILGTIADEQVKKRAYVLAKNEVQRRVAAEGESFTPDLVADVVQNLRWLNTKPQGQQGQTGGQSGQSAAASLESLRGLPPDVLALIQGQMNNEQLQAGSSNRGGSASNPGGHPAQGSSSGPQEPPRFQDQDAWISDFKQAVAKKLAESEQRSGGESSLNR